MGVSMPGMVAPTLDVAEIDKRITDLKSVENWLNLNLNVLRMTIQGLEMQKATLAAMQSGVADSSRAMQGSMPGVVWPGGAGVPLQGDAWWTILQQAQQAAERARSSEPDDPSGKK